MIKIKKTLLALVAVFPLFCNAQTLHKGSYNFTTYCVEEAGHELTRTVNYHFYYDENDREVPHGKFSVVGPKELYYERGISTYYGTWGTINVNGSHNHGELNGPISIKLNETGFYSTLQVNKRFNKASGSLTGTYKDGFPDKTWNISLNDGNNSKLNATAAFDQGRLLKLKTSASGSYFAGDCSYDKFVIDVTLDADGFASGTFQGKDGNRYVLKNGIITNYFIRKNGSLTEIDDAEKQLLAQITANNGVVDEMELMEKGYRLEERSFDIDLYFNRYLHWKIMPLNSFDDHLNRFPSTIKYKMLTRNFVNPYDAKKEHVEKVVKASTANADLATQWASMQQAQQTIDSLRQEAESMHSKALTAFCDDQAQKLHLHKKTMLTDAVLRLEKGWNPSTPNWKRMEGIDGFVQSMRSTGDSTTTAFCDTQLRKLLQLRQSTLTYTIGALEKEWNPAEPDWKMVDDAVDILKSMRIATGDSTVSAFCRKQEQRLQPFLTYHVAAHSNSPYGQLDKMVPRMLKSLTNKPNRFAFLTSLITVGFDNFSSSQLDHYVGLANQNISSSEEMMDLYMTLFSGANRKKDYPAVVHYADYVRALNETVAISPSKGDAKDVDFAMQNALFQMNRQQQNLSSPMVVNRELLFMRHDSILTFDVSTHAIVPSSYHIDTTFDNRHYVVRPGEYALLPSGDIDQQLLDTTVWSKGQLTLAKLTITSEPSGAIIYIDGKRMDSQTPFTIERMADDTYEIYLFHPSDSASANQKVAVKGGQDNRADIKLNNSFNVTFHSNISEGKTLVDGSNIGLANSLSLQRGSHTVVVKAKDYQPLKQDFYLNADRDIQLTLTPKPELETVFMSADIYVGSNGFNSMAFTFGHVAKRFGWFASMSTGRKMWMSGYRVGNELYDNDDVMIDPSGYTFRRNGSAMRSIIVGPVVRLSNQFMLMAGLGYANMYKFAVYKAPYEGTYGETTTTRKYIISETQKKALSATLDMAWYQPDEGLFLMCGVKMVGTTPLCHIGIGLGL